VQAARQAIVPLCQRMGAIRCRRSGPTGTQPWTGLERHRLESNWRVRVLIQKLLSHTVAVVLFAASVSIIALGEPPPKQPPPPGIASVGAL
jgi:hypothetical protein